MSVGTLKEDHDKQNNICRVVDVILHPNIVQTVKTDESLRQFVRELLVSYLKEKFKLDIKPN